MARLLKLRLIGSTAYYAEEAGVPGKELVLPWPGKKEVVKSWNGVIVEKSSSEGNKKAGTVVIVYPILSSECTYTIARYY